MIVTLKGLTKPTFKDQSSFKLENSMHGDMRISFMENANVIHCPGCIRIS